MWDADPLGFMREQARMDPPVVSYTSLATEDTEELILGAKVLVKKGTTREMCISVANRDRTVFGDDVGALVSPSYHNRLTCWVANPSSTSSHFNRYIFFRL